MTVPTLAIRVHSLAAELPRDAPRSVGDFHLRGFPRLWSFSSSAIARNLSRQHACCAGKRSAARCHVFDNWTEQTVNSQSHLGARGEAEEVARRRARPPSHKAGPADLFPVRFHQLLQRRLVCMVGEEAVARCGQDADNVAELWTPVAAKVDCICLCGSCQRWSSLQDIADTIASSLLPQSPPRPARAPRLGDGARRSALPMELAPGMTSCPAGLVRKGRRRVRTS